MVIHIIYWFCINIHSFAKKSMLINAYLDVLVCPMVSWGIKTDLSVMDKQVTITPINQEMGGGGVLVTCIYTTDHMKTGNQQLM